MSANRCTGPNADLSGKRPTPNTGENRLNCFNCDFTMCKPCALGENTNTNGWLAADEAVAEAGGGNLLVVDHTHYLR
jgi:hypothetical protein